MFNIFKFFLLNKYIDVRKGGGHDLKVVVVRKITESGKGSIKVKGVDFANVIETTLLSLDNCKILNS